MAAWRNFFSDVPFYQQQKIFSMAWIARKNRRSTHVKNVSTLSIYNSISLTMIYKWDNDQWSVADVNQTLRALSVNWNDKEQVFRAYDKNGAETSFKYKNKKLQQLSQ